MEFKELQKKKESELHKILAESRDQLRDMRFKIASKQLKDVSVVKKTKVVIASILTLLNGKKEASPSMNVTADQEVKPAEEKK